MRGAAAGVSHPSWVSVLLRGLIWLGVAAVVVVGGVYGVQRYLHSKGAAATPRFFTVTAGVGTVDVTVSGSGSIQAVATQNVSPPEAGAIEKVDVGLAQNVAPGQVLLQLSDTSGLGQQVASAQAALAQAQEQLQSLMDPAAAQDPRTITQAQLKLQQARVSLQLAELTQSRDDANAAAASEVTTPVAGTVQSVAVVVGQQVNPGEPIATVLPAGAPTISVPVPEEDLPYLSTGDSATLTIPSLARVQTGTVTGIGTSPVSGAQVSVQAGGGSARQASPSTQTEQLYPLTVTPSQPLIGVPQEAAVTVVLTPQGTPPAAFTWSDAGSVVYPALQTVTAGQAGTVGGLVAEGAPVSAQQVLATVTNPTVAATAQQDQLAVAQAKLAVQEAQIALAQITDPAAPTADAVAAQKAVVASDAAAVQAKQTAMAELTVTAPIAGTITAINVQPGESVAAGTAAVTIQSAQGLEAVVPIDELDIGKVRVGQSAQVTVNAFPNAQYTGTVVSVAPAAQAQNGVSTYPVTVDLKNQQNLLPGMSATVIIDVASANGLRVPSQAVHATGGSGGVLRVLQNGKPVAVRVRVGLVGSAYTQILAGLQPGQSVIAGQAAGGVGTAARGAPARAGGGALGGGGFAGAFGRAGG